MKDEQGTLVFHNKNLIHISNNVLFLFGGNPIAIRGKEMSEIFMSCCVEEIDSVKNNKSCKLSLSTIDGNILDCVVTKSIIGKNETICIYINITASMVSDKSAIMTTGVFQETNKENLERIFKVIDSIETVRNKKTLNLIKEMIASNSMDMYELLTLTDKNANKEFEGTYTTFNFISLLEEATQKTQNKYKNHTVSLIPKINPLFRISSDKESLEKLILLCADMIAKTDDKIYFIVKMETSTITLAISQDFIPRNLVYHKTKVMSFDPQKVDEVLKLNELAKKSGAEFSYAKYTDGTELIKISFTSPQTIKLYKNRVKNYNTNNSLHYY